MVEESTTVKLAAGVAPKFTAVTPKKLVPLIVTVVPPADGPLVGSTPVTVGTPGVNVNSLANVATEVPAQVVTVTLTVWHSVPAGDTALIVVALTTVKLAAGVAPKFTAVTPKKLVPVIATGVLPADEPLFGLRPVTVGSGGL
jgi:hypothetical protein